VIARRDGSLQLHDLGSLAPLWRAAGPFHDTSSSPTWLTQRGWRSPGGDPGASWRQAVERSNLARGTTDGSVCLWRARRHLELWEVKRDRRAWRREVAGLGQLVPLASACAILADRRAALIDARGRERLLHGDATAIAIDDSGRRLLLAAGDRVQVHDLAGSLMRTLNGGVGVTALLARRGGEQLALGYADGSVELSAGGGSSTRVPSTTGNPVTALAFGPANTLFIGHAGGTVQGWQLADLSSPFYRGKLHGPVAWVLIDNARLHAVTRLGDHLDLDLGDLQRPYCELLRQVWRSVPVVWGGTRAVFRVPPRDHRCSVSR
jgi:hypothetical protein